MFGLSLDVDSFGHGERKAECRRGDDHEKEREEHDLARAVVAVFSPGPPSKSIEVVESTSDVLLGQWESNRIDVAEENVEEGGNIVFGRELG